MDITVIDQPISREALRVIAQETFGDMAKAVVDIDRKVMAIGGDLHADGEALLLEKGSLQQSLWGINFYPDKTGGEWIEFDSMINIRPSQNNRSRSVEDPHIQDIIRGIVEGLIV